MSKQNRQCEYLDKQTLLYYIGLDKDGLGNEAKKEYKRRYGVSFVKELEAAGWEPGKNDDGKPGWFDPQTGVHYYAEQAVAVNINRNRKGRFGREPRPY